MNLLQHMCEHLHVTHIVDFTPGSAALAVAAAGARQYEGIAANDQHREWLDDIVDKHILHMVGQDQQVAAKFGGDGDLIDKVGKFLAGAMLGKSCE